jgi:hypothetical protein
MVYIPITIKTNTKLNIESSRLEGMHFGLHQFREHLDDPEFWKLSRTWINDCTSNHVRSCPKATVPGAVYSQYLMGREVGITVSNWAY